MSLSRFAGQFRALDFAYGGSFDTAPTALTVVSAPGASGAQTITVQNGFITLSDGTVVTPLATTAPIYIGTGANGETVTPSAVSNNQISSLFGQSATATATFSNAHYPGDRVASGTVGLQEAINFASASGGGTVIIDGKWTLNGGTQAMVAAATLPTAGSVQILDLRAGSGNAQTLTLAVPNASVLTLNTVGVPILPAPGAGNLYEIDRLWIECVSSTPAFTGGGNITLAYGTQAAQTAATVAIAATLLTASATVAQVGSALPVTVANGVTTTLSNKAVGLYAATADFAAGGGSLIVKVSYRVLTGF